MKDHQTSDRSNTHAVCFVLFVFVEMRNVRLLCSTMKTDIFRATTVDDAAQRWWLVVFVEGGGMVGSVC